MQGINFCYLLFQKKEGVVMVIYLKKMWCFGENISWSPPAEWLRRGPKEKDFPVTPVCLHGSGEDGGERIIGRDKSL